MSFGDELLCCGPGLIVIVAFLTIVGAITVAQWFLRGRAQPPPPVPPRPTPKKKALRTTCARCGAQLPAGQLDCLRCGLDNEGVVAAELADLEATARQLERFQRQAQLPQTEIDAWWRSVHERHALLTGAPDEQVPLATLAPLPLASHLPPKSKAQSSLPLPSVIPLTSDAPRNPMAGAVEVPLDIGTPPPLVSQPSLIPIEEQNLPWRRMEVLLNKAAIEPLTSSERVRVLLLHKHCPEERLRSFTPWALRELILVLQQATRLEDALQTCRLFLSVYPNEHAAAELALLGARLGLQLRRQELAESLLALAERQPLTVAQRAELAELQRSLSTPGIPTPARPDEVVEGELARPPAVAVVVPILVEARAEPATVVPVLRPAAPPPPPPPSRVRRTWGEMWATFMEERNILWGELVGGLLIVGGSIALVISLWQTLQDNPYLPFGIFSAVAAALLGAGWYTLHHWKLDSTSRGLLVIGALLVPLCYLVTPGLLDEPTDWKELVVTGSVLVFFAWLLTLAGKVLTPQPSLALPLAIAGSALGQLLTEKWVYGAPVHELLIVAIGALPAVCHTVGCLWPYARLRRLETLAPHDGWKLLGLVGMATFALLIALGTLVSSSANNLVALQLLSMFLCTAALPALAAGILIHRGPLAAPEESTLRATGTATIIAAMFLMLLAVITAWPRPTTVVVVCGLNTVLLVGFAFRASLPVLHYGALACSTVGFWMVFKLRREYNLDLGDELVAEFATMPTALRLLPLGLVYLLISELLARRSTEDARPYVRCAGAVGLIVLGLALWHGAPQPYTAALICATEAVVALLVNLRWRRLWLTHAGLALLHLAPLWLMHGLAPAAFSAWTPVLAATLLLVGLVGSALTWLGRKQPEPRRELLHALYAVPCLQWAWLGGVIVFAADVGLAWREPLHGGHAVAQLLLCAGQVLVAAHGRRFGTGLLSSVALLGGVIATTSWLGRVLVLGDVQPLLALNVSAAALAMTVVRLYVLERRPASWLAALVAGWRDTVAAAGLAAIALALSSDRNTATALHTYTWATAALIAWLLAWEHRSTLLAWLGSVLLLAGCDHCLSYYTELPLVRLVLTALLTHATILFAAVLPLDRLARRRGWGPALTQLLAALYWSALSATVLAVACLLLDAEALATRVPLTAWLAALWLVVVWLRMQPVLFAAWQLLLGLLVGQLCTLWLQEQSWVRADPGHGLWDPRSLHIYGLGLTALALLWVLVRLVGRSTLRVRTLLLPSYPGVDRLLLLTLVVGLTGLTDWALLHDVLSEWLPGKRAAFGFLWHEHYAQAYGLLAWLMLLALAGVCTLALWQPAPTLRREDAIWSLVLLGTTVPALLAGLSARLHAAGVAYAWHLAWAFVLLSALCWLRGYLERWAGALRQPATGEHVARSVRWLLLDAAAIPVVLLCVLRFTLLANGLEPATPTEPSFLATWGQAALILLPLGLLVPGLIGHGVRERSPRYIAPAVWLTTAIVLGYYALRVISVGEKFREHEWGMLLHLGAATLTLAVLVWHWCSRAPEEEHLGQRLRLGHLTLALAVFAGLQLVGAGTIALVSGTAQAGLKPPWYDAPLDLVRLTGAWLSWLTLGLLTLAGVRCRLAQRRFRAGALLLAAVVGLLACTVENHWPTFGYRTLLYSTAAATAVFGALLQLRRFEGTASQAQLAPRLWLGGAQLFVLLLSGKAALLHADYLHAGLALALSSAAGLAAVWRLRLPAALFRYGCYLMLAAALLLWHRHRTDPFADWWIYLLQASAIVAALLAVAWNRWLAQREQGAAADSWQVAQALWAGLFCVLPLLLVLGCVYHAPERFFALYHQAGGGLGWLALGATAAALLGLGAQRKLSWLPHLVGVLGLLFAVQCAATAVHLWPKPWLAYRVFGVVLSVTGALTLLLASRVQRETLSGPLGHFFVSRTWLLERTRDALAVWPTRCWLEALSLLLLSCGLHGALDEPGKPFWPLMPLLGASVLVGGLLVWTRCYLYLNLLALALGCAALVGWLGLARQEVQQLLSVLALAAAALTALCALIPSWIAPAEQPQSLRMTKASYWLCVGALPVLAWLLFLLLLTFAATGQPLEAFLESYALFAAHAHYALLLVLLVYALLQLLNAGRGHDAYRLASLESSTQRDQLARFGDAAALVGCNLLALLVIAGLASDATGELLYMAQPLSWAAAVLLGSAAVVKLAHAEQGESAFVLYFVGLLTAGLAVHAAALEPRTLGYVLPLMLGCYSVLALALVWLLGFGKATELRRLLGLTKCAPERWLPPVQMGLALVLVVWGLVIAVDYATQPERLMGALILLSAVLACVLLAVVQQRGEVALQMRLLPWLRRAALVAGVLFMLGLAWALQAADVVWLYRHVVVVTVLVLATLLYALALPLLLPRQLGWLRDARTMANLTGSVGVVALLALIAHETLLYDAQLRIVPLEPWAIVCVAVTLAGCIAAPLLFALQPQRDPFGLPEAWRTSYVYAAEVFAVLLFVHLRLTIPARLQLFAPYWPFTIVLLAYLGVGLAAYFERRNLAVLAVPLQRTGIFLPLLPLAAYWLVPHHPQLPSALHRFSGYSLLWFQVAVLYALLAATRRTQAFALLAALAGNFGLWSAFYHYQDQGFSFYAHPQLWLIPLALIILVTQHLNEKELPPSASASLRYLGLTMLYLSSTADLFLTGLGSLWMSIVLALLAIAGVFAGIVFRVRAFLFAGITFLVLVLFARIWHAAVDQAQTWVWWVTVIALGVLILVMFAIFEKRRQDVLKMIDELKRWR